MKPSVFIQYPIFGKISTNLNKLTKEFAVTISKKWSSSEKELKTIFRMYDAVIIGSGLKIDKPVLEGSRVRLIIRIGTGLDGINLKFCKNKGIRVISTGHINSNSVAEYVLAQIFCISKKLFEADSEIRKGNFSWRWNFKQQECKGKTLGIVGLGNIGQSLAIKANCFGFNVISYTSNPKKKKNFCHKNKVKLVSIKSLLRNSDFVSLNLPLTEKTKGFIDFDKLSLMKPTAWLINTSRGGIINEDALLKAVEKKIIAGVALDVFCNEPKPRKELLKNKKVILTPHIAGLTKEVWIASEYKVVEILEEFFGIKDRVKK